MSNLPEFLVMADKDGFFIVDENDDEVTYGWSLGKPVYRRFTSWRAAQEECARLHQEYLDGCNDPPDGDAWSGGIAESH